MRLVQYLAAAACLALVGCSPSATEEAAETHASPTIDVTGAFLVEPPVGRDVTMGGFTITATGAPFQLVSVSSDMAERVELHTMSMDDGVMKMRQVDGFDIEPGTALVLDRGGNHLMLFGLSPSLAAGGTSELVLTLTDESGAEQTVSTTAEIRGLGD